MNSSNILFIVPQLPYPPHHGSSIRNYNLIRTLAERHTIDLLAFSTPENELTKANPLHHICRSVATIPQPIRTSAVRILDTFRRRLPDMALRLESEPMRAIVQQWAVADRSQTRYDIVQVEGIEMAQYGLAILDAFERLGDGETHKRPLLVFDDHNCEYLLQKRNALNDLKLPKRWPAALYSLVQWQKLRWYERLICHRSDAVSVVSPADRDVLHELVAPIDKTIDITVVSNGVALDEYVSVEQDNSQNALPLAESANDQSKKLVFVGKMDYRPNVDAVLWFADHVLPLIRQQDSSVVFQIVGMNPHERLDVLRGRDGIFITGQVDEVAPYLRSAAVYVIPLRVGGGTRFKALEAMAASMPIVSTRLGVEGIPVEHGQELLLADTAESFAQEVLRLLAEDDDAKNLCQTLGVSGRRFVAEHYGWQTIVPKLEEIYTRIQSRT